MAKADKAEAVESGSPSLLVIFGVLETVFSGEKQYDEALEVLDLHVASVRKAYPALFDAMSSRANKDVVTKDAVEEIVVGKLKALESLITNLSNKNGSGSHTQASVQQPQAVVSEPPVEEEEPDVELHDNGIASKPYSVWATEAPNTAIEGQEFYVKWDVPSLPSGKVLNLGTPFTLKGKIHRTRFSVEEILEDDLFRIKAVAIMPHSRG